MKKMFLSVEYINNKYNKDNKNNKYDKREITEKEVSEKRVTEKKDYLSMKKVTEKKDYLSMKFDLKDVIKYILLDSNPVFVFKNGLEVCRLFYYKLSDNPRKRSIIINNLYINFFKKKFGINGDIINYIIDYEFENTNKDVKVRDVKEGNVKGRIKLPCSYSKDISIGRGWYSDQYNLLNFLDKIKNKTVIDVGANVGLFSVFAANLGVAKVYAFEPVTETYNHLRQFIKANGLEHKITAVNSGLGDKHETKEINIGRYCDAGATFVDLRVKIENDKHRKQNATITTLDSFVEKNNIKNIAFIKMDCEGYERNVLIGAKKTIKKFKPIISMSAYHLPDDKQVLPQIILGIRKDYKYKLLQRDEEDFLFY